MMDTFRKHFKKNHITKQRNSYSPNISLSDYVVQKKNNDDIAYSSQNISDGIAAGNWDAFCDLYPYTDINNGNSINT